MVGLINAFIKRLFFKTVSVLKPLTFITFQSYLFQSLLRFRRYTHQTNLSGVYVAANFSADIVKQKKKSNESFLLGDGKVFLHNFALFWYTFGNYYSLTASRGANIEFKYLFPDVVVV